MVEEVNSVRCCKKRSEDENWKSTGFGEKVLRNCEWLWGRGGAVPVSVETKMLHRKVLAPILLKVKGAQLCPTLCDPMDYTVHGTLQARTLELGSLSFLQGIFPTQGLNSGLPHCRQILYQLSHKGSPKILEWVAYPFSRGSS